MTLEPNKMTHWKWLAWWTTSHWHATADDQLLKQNAISTEQQGPSIKVAVLCKFWDPSASSARKKKIFKKTQLFNTLQGINISQGKGKSSSKCHFLGDMFVPWRVAFPLPGQPGLSGGVQCTTKERGSKSKRWGGWHRAGKQLLGNKPLRNP